MANLNSTPALEALAAEIGENIYIDVAKWHLFLAEAHLHTAVAEKVIPLIEDNALSSDAIERVLSEIPVSLGGGKLTHSLAELIPTSGHQALLQLLEDLAEE